MHASQNWREGKIGLAKTDPIVFVTRKGRGTLSQVVKENFASGLAVSIGRRGVLSRVRLYDKGRYHIFN